jgi:hypothetical protein
MRIFFATLAFATLLTFPALAQYGSWQRPYRAYAQQIPPYAAYNYYRGTYAASPSVYSTRGRYLGSDPDPRVRTMMAHDPTGSD